MSKVHSHWPKSTCKRFEKVASNNLGRKGKLWVVIKQHSDQIGHILYIFHCLLNLFVSSVSPSLVRDPMKTVYTLNLHEFTKVMPSHEAFLETTIEVSPQGTPASLLSHFLPKTNTFSYLLFCFSFLSIDMN